MSSLPISRLYYHLLSIVWEAQTFPILLGTFGLLPLPMAAFMKGLLEAGRDKNWWPKISTDSGKQDTKVGQCEPQLDLSGARSECTAETRGGVGEQQRSDLTPMSSQLWMVQPAGQCAPKRPRGEIKIKQCQRMCVSQGSLAKWDQ